MDNSTSLKEEIVKILDTIEDEDVLHLLKKDIAFYATTKNATDILTEKQYKELELLATEPKDKDATTLEGLKKSTNRLRTGL